jgi:O-antigen/teichoic acid export membrane protein
MSLVYKSVTGSFWAFLDIVFNKIVYFIATLILARLLGPVEFGYIGLLLVFVAIGNTMIDSGLSVSLVRAIKPDDIEYSTIFFFNIILSLITYLIIFSIAPLIADFYNLPILKNLLRVYCLSFIISAFRIIPQVLLIKDMNFKKITILNIPGNIIGLILSVWMAMHNYKIWSIVSLHLSTQLVTTLMFWFYIKWKPKLEFSISKMKYHWTFGYKLMLSAQLNTFFDNIYNILIGKIYNIQTLGYYERAYTLNNYPVSILSGIINKVSFPLLSNLLEDQKRIKNVFRNILMLSFYISAPLMLGALVIAKPMFILILGKQWLPAVPFFQILCLGYMVYPVHTLNVNILTVYGRSDLFLKLEGVKKVMVLLLIIVSIKYGVYGLVWSSVLASFAGLFINTYYTGSLISYFTKDQLKDILPTFIYSIIMAIFMFAIYSFLSSCSESTQLLITALFGFIIYISISILAKNNSFYFLLNQIKNIKTYDSSN